MYLREANKDAYKKQKKQKTKKLQLQGHLSIYLTIDLLILSVSRDQSLIRGKGGLTT